MAENNGSTTVTTKVTTEKRQVSMPVPLNAGVGVIKITRGNVTRHYLLRCVGAARFNLTSFTDEGDGGGEIYSVVLKGEDSVCTCKGYANHKVPCKHILGLGALFEKGKL